MCEGSNKKVLVKLKLTSKEKEEIVLYSKEKQQTFSELALAGIAIIVYSYDYMIIERKRVDKKEKIVFKVSPTMYNLLKLKAIEEEVTIQDIVYAGIYKIINT